MAATYKGILTNNGKALIASATLNNKINYSHIAVGDGNGSVPTPSETRTALVNEKARIALNVVEINPNNTNQIVCEAIIPTTTGGFYIRELGLYAGSTLVVNASYPPTYKPLADEGGAREIALKLVINIQNAEVIALYLDDSLIYATRDWVNKNYIRRNEIVDNLTTDDPAKPLSAKQGKSLQDSKVQIGSSFKDAHSRDVDYYQDISSQQFFTSFDELPLGSRCLIQSSLNLTKAPLFAGETFIYVETKATYKKDMPGKLQLAYGYGSGKFAIRSAPTDGVYTAWFYYADINSNVASASKLATARTVSFSGGVTGSFNYDGSGNSSCILTLANSGVILGTYASTIQIPQITVNAAGQITGISQQNIRSASITQTGVVQLIDDLATADASKALTAKQGKVLQDNKLDKTEIAVAAKKLSLEQSSYSTDQEFIQYYKDKSTAFFDNGVGKFIPQFSPGLVSSLIGGGTFIIASDVLTGRTKVISCVVRENGTIDYLSQKEIAYKDSDISGNAATSTKLKNARKINTIDFDGTQDISIEAPLRYLGNISSAAQLDLALSDGKYTVYEYSVAGLYSYGVLVVLRSGGTCCQIYYPHLASGANGGTLAIRQSWNVNGNSASWSEWRVIGTRDDSKLPLSGGSLTGDLTVPAVLTDKIWGNEDVSFASLNDAKARRIRVGGLLVSNAWTDATKIPENGIYSKGDIQTSNSIYADNFYGYAAQAIFHGIFDGRLQNPRMINGVAFDASLDIDIPPVSFYIPAGANLNNYQTTGFFYQPADAVANQISNVPQQNAFSLRVEKSAGCSQWFTPYDSNGVTYYRRFYGGEWSTWVKIDPANVNGNAGTATRLKTSRNIALSGAVSGNADFDGSGNITISTTANNAIGVSQSWQDVKLNRAVRTTYTNTTGRPIQLFINANFDDGYITLNGTKHFIADAAAWGWINLIIPNGDTYMIEGSGDQRILTWLELR
ncbi:phage tail protein [Acinetobacter baumannii]|uniref:phage tail-collar fiber domain-containing protein n=1 Tax=Acinetobacter baumannii TaxID=470 RepID=UPI0018AF986D|nr:phage tail protein [Acinetobacter baumannii]MBF9261009.1 phage tail protein [Acinetobacter baumannii]